MRVAARSIAKNDKISLHQAYNQIAEKEGFASWQALRDFTNPAEKPNGASAEDPKKGAKSGSKRKPKKQSPVVVMRPLPLIEALPKRSMYELQIQWLNCLKVLDGQHSGHAIAAKAVKEAILVEWERRHRLALDDPDYFGWPSTDVGKPTGEQTFNGRHAEGMLKFFGYAVGRTGGVSVASRRLILDAIFSSGLPPINDAEYMRGWSVPTSPMRLKRLAYELAGFAKNAKKNGSADYTDAIADWESDLKYLYRKYYVAHFGFAWPST